MMLLIVGVIAGALWYVNDRGRQRLADLEPQTEEANRLAEEKNRVARLEQGIEDALANALLMREKSLKLTERPFEWGAMLASVRASERRAQSLLEQGPERIDPQLKTQWESLQRELSQDEQDQQFVTRYERIRLDMDRVDVEDSTWDSTRAFPDMLEALQQNGFHPEQISVQQAVELLEKRPERIRQQWIVALDFCLTVSSVENDTENQWILSALKEVDPDPWSDRVRQVFVMKDRRETLEKLRGEIKDLKNHPRSLMVMFARALAGSYIGGPGIPLLEELHNLKPDDFWINADIGMRRMSLAHHLEQDLRHKQGARASYLAALSCTRAALALRPKNAGVWVNDGVRLMHAGDEKSAEIAYNTALRLDSNYAVAWDNLGMLLGLLGQQRRYGEAETCFRKAIRLTPNDPQPHANLGAILSEDEE